MKSIKALGKKVRHTYSSLAEYMGVSRQTISKWDRGESEPSYKQAIKLAKELNVDVEYLMEVNDGKR